MPEGEKDLQVKFNELLNYYKYKYICYNPER